MTQNWRGSWGWKLGLTSFLATGGAIASGNCGLAQIKPDSTLGPERSSVTPNVLIKGLPSDQIDGGARRGANLFHSFREFNIDQGRGAYFTNPAGIENILSRVTGVSSSNILGKLGVLGNANLFLINPNGIIFGPNASLDIRGSFAASTTSSLNFADGSQFSAVNPEAPPLLTVNVVPGVQFGRNQPGEITNAGNLTVGQNLALSGGTVVGTGQLAAPAGQVAVTAVSGDVQVRELTARSAILSANNNITTGDINTSSLLEDGGDISLTSDNGAINTSAGTLKSNAADNGNDSFGFSGNGGNITLKAYNDITTGNISTLIGYGGVGNAGNISLTSAAGAIDTSAGRLDTGATYGNGGAVTLKAADSITTGEVWSHSLANGNGGAVTLKAHNDITTAEIRTLIGYGGVGNAGNISLTSTAGAIDARAGSLDAGATFGSGGTITLKAYDDIITGGIRTNKVGTDREAENAGDISLTSIAGAIDTTAGDLNSFSENGSAGAVNLNAADSITTGNIRSYSLVSGSGGDINFTSNAGVYLANSSVNSVALGPVKGGDINITAESLYVTDGTNLVTSTFGKGDAGSVNINARDSVSFDGVGSIIFSTAEPGATGNAGNINVTTRSLEVKNGAQLLALTRGWGDAGSVTINASDKVSFDGSLVLSRVEPGAIGNGGDINITTGSLFMAAGAVLQATTFGQGDSTAGSINIQADQLSLSSNASIEADTLSAGQAGDINLDVTGANLLTGGTPAPPGESTRITLGAQPWGTGSGGELTINAGSLVLTDGAIIKANTQGPGNAGNIYVNADVVDISGSVPSSGLPSGLFTSTDTAGSAGDIFVDTRTFRIANGAVLSARSKGGRAGWRHQGKCHQLI